MAGPIPGINMADGIGRCGNCPELYMRFLKRFPSDPSLTNLADALRDGRMQDAFRFAHTLKGLAAQLGITALYTPVDMLCELLRTEDANMLPEAKRLLRIMTPVYQTIIREIDALP